VAILIGAIKVGKLLCGTMIMHGLFQEVKQELKTEK